MAHRSLQRLNGAGLTKGDRRREADRRASPDRRGTGDYAMGSLTPRPYGFRAFNERRSQRGRRMYEGEPFGEQATTPAPLATQANAVTVGVDPRQPPLEQADRPGEFRVLSVRRMGPRDGSPASPPPRGRIVDWVV